MGKAIIPFGSNLTAQFAAIQTRLNLELKKIEGDTMTGLMEASIHIRREMEDVIPVTPVDTGNLRQSWITVASSGKKVRDPIGSGRFKDNPKTGIKASTMKDDHKALISEAKGVAKSRSGPAVIMGYSANYAAPVHEMMDKRFKKSGAGPKWFETAVKRNSDKIVKIVADNARIKG